MAFCISINFDLPAQHSQYSVFEFNNNLSRGLIKDVTTDSLGFVWVATDEGAIRFDGGNTLFFRKQIKGGFAKAFCKTSKDGLYLLHDFGLTRIESRPDTVLFQQLLEGDLNDKDEKLHYPKTLFQDSNGFFWIGENQSIVKYAKGQFKKYRFNNNMDFGLISRSFSFIENTDGVLWAISHSGQLFYYNPAIDNFVKQPLAQAVSEVSSLIKVENDVYWLGTKDGVFQLDLNKSEKPLSITKVGGPKGISCGIATPAREIFYGTWRDGLYKVNLTANPFQFEKITAVNFEDIVGLSFDPRNGLWACGHENLVLLKPVLFEVFDFQIDPSPTISSLRLNSDGSVLVIGDQLQINTQEIYFVGKDKVQWEMGLPNNPVGNIPLAAFSDAKGIWIGDLGGEVYFFDKRNGKTKKWDGVRSSNSPIADIEKDQLGNVWVAGNKTHGLIRIDTQGQNHFYKMKGLTNCKVVSFGKDGVLYAGGNGAESYLFKYFPKSDSFQNISLPIKGQTIDNIDVLDIVESADGSLVLATNSGVFKVPIGLEKGEAIHVDLQEVPVDEPCNALAFAADGTLWVSTSSGLVAHNNTSSYVFDRSAGLPSNSLTDRGLLFDNNGNLWVGTARGLALLQLSSSNFKVTQAPIITSLKVNDKWQALDSPAYEAAFNAGIEVGYISLSYPTQDVKYMTRILGKDTSWSEPSTQKLRYIGGLAPGVYTFEVKAQQLEGMLWSKPTQLKLEVLEPWHSKWWVKLLMGLTAIGLIILVSRLYNLNLIRQKKKLESLVRERTLEVNRQKNEIIEQQKQLIEQSENVRKLEEVQYHNDLEYKNKQLTTHTLHLIQKNQTLKDLRLKIHETIRSSSKSTYKEMRGLLNLIDFSFRRDEEWDNFKLYFEEVHVGFFEQLKSRHPKLTSQDLRHCALIRLNLSIEEMATIIGISADSIKTARFRMKKKMDLDSTTELLEYLMKI